MSETIKEKMQAEITEKLGDAFESVIKQKNEYYQNNPEKIPESSQVDALIRSNALANAAISGGASLIPGPLGMLAIVPELVAVIRNQVALIYDIAAANGKKDVLTKELAASIFMYSLGTTAGGLLTVQGSRYLVRRASLQVFQKIVLFLGGKITQQALKSILSKWLPGIGAAAMAAWTNYSTRQIGKKAHEILSSDIVFDDKIEDIEIIEPLNENNNQSSTHKKPIEFYKLVTLISLAKIDGHLDDKEAEFIGGLIEASEVESGLKIELIAMLAKEKVSIEGLEIIKESPSDAIMLLSELTTLAKADNNFHITEKMFIKQIGKALGFSTSDIDDVMQA